MFVLEDMSKMEGGRCLFLRICLRWREVFVLEDMSKMQGGVCS